MTAPVEDEPPELSAQNARFGRKLFAIYLLLYAGFMLINAFAPSVMARPALAGVNVAIIYGLTLILGAFVLAVVYMIGCRQAAIRFADKRQFERTPGFDS